MEDHGESVVVPTATRIDTIRGVLTALAEPEPSGIASAGSQILGMFLPTGLQHRTREFHER